MADDLAAQIVAAAQIADTLASKQFRVVSVDKDDPVYVEYSVFHGFSNRGNPKYNDKRDLLQSLLSEGWRIERQFTPVCDMGDRHVNKPDWQPRVCFVLCSSPRLRSEEFFFFFCTVHRS